MWNPYRPILIDVPERPQAALNALADHVGRGPVIRFLFFQSCHRAFVGTVDVERRAFWISRVHEYVRNSFQPVLRGRVQEHGDGSRITIRVWSNWFTFFPLAIWIAALVWIPELADVVGIAILCILPFTLWAFWSEVAPSTRLLLECLPRGAKIVPAQTERSKP